MAGYLLLGKQYVSHPGADGDPAVLLLGRQLLAAVMMSVIAAVRDGCVLPQREDRLAIHALGFLNFVNAIGCVWGGKLTTAFTTSVIQLSIPVLTLTASVIMRLEPLSMAKVGGVRQHTPLLSQSSRPHADCTTEVHTSCEQSCSHMATAQSHGDDGALLNGRRIGGVE